MWVITLWPQHARILHLLLLLLFWMQGTYCDMYIIFNLTALCKYPILFECLCLAQNISEIPTF